MGRVGLATGRVDVFHIAATRGAMTVACLHCARWAAAHGARCFRLPDQGRCLRAYTVRHCSALVARMSGGVRHAPAGL
jgi:hypothetical protein